LALIRPEVHYPACQLLVKEINDAQPQQGWHRGFLWSSSIGT
jgi:hypothetical protein